MAKKAQFYLIGALIIAMIIAGLTATVNYAIVQPEPIKFYDLSENFEAETTKLIDYGIYQEEVEIESVIENFTTSFLTYAYEKDPNLELVYVYGNKDNLTIINYAREEAEIETAKVTGIEDAAPGANLSISRVGFQVADKAFVRDVSQRMTHFGNIRRDIEVPGDWVRVTLLGIPYDFNLREEEGIYFIMRTGGTLEAPERTGYIPKQECDASKGYHRKTIEGEELCVTTCEFENVENYDYYLYNPERCYLTGCEDIVYSHPPQIEELNYICAGREGYTKLMIDNFESINCEPDYRLEIVKQYGSIDISSIDIDIIKIETGDVCGMRIFKKSD